MVEDYSTGPQGQVYGGTSQVDQEKCTLKTDKYLLRNATATDINLSKCVESDFSSLSHFVIFLCLRYTHYIPLCFSFSLCFNIKQLQKLNYVVAIVFGVSCQNYRLCTLP